MTDLLFLRHPTPEVTPGTCYGQLDLDIAEIGHQQIARALEITPPVKRIFASPALRCRKLALALGERDGLAVVFDPRLWEMNMGEWEGMPWSAINRELSEIWLKDPLNQPAPGGETFGEVQARVLAAITEIGFDSETAIICHAGPIRAMQMIFEGMSFQEAYATSPPYAEPVWVSRQKNSQA